MLPRCGPSSCSDWPMPTSCVRSINRRDGSARCSISTSAMAARGSTPCATRYCGRGVSGHERAARVRPAAVGALPGADVAAVPAGRTGGGRGRAVANRPAVRGAQRARARLGVDAHRLVQGGRGAVAVDAGCQRIRARSRVVVQPGRAVAAFFDFRRSAGGMGADELWMRRLLWSVTGVVTFVAADVWLQYATGTDLFGHQRPSDERLSGPFDGLRAGIFIAKLMFPVVLGAFLWQAWQRPAKKLLLVALTALMVGAVFVSGERMALLLSLAGLALVVLLQRGAARRLLGAVMVCAVMSVVVLALADPRMLQRHVAQTAATAESLRDSPYGQIWHSALHLAGERPLVGVGMKNFRIACEDPVLGLPASMTLRCATHPHNLYLEWLTEAGVPGLAGFLMLVAVWLRQIWQGYRAVPLNLWLFGPLVTLALHLWPLGPSGSFVSSWFGAIFWLCLGWARAALRLQERPR